MALTENNISTATNVSLLSMDTAEVNGTTNSPTSPAAGMTQEVMYILIGALAGTIFLLSVVLTVIYCRRKRIKKIFNSTIESGGGPQRNLSFEDDPDDDPIYRPSQDIEDGTDGSSTYSNVRGNNSVSIRDAHLSASGSYVDVDAPRLSSSSQTSDYENAAGLEYENCHNSRPRLVSEALSPVDENGPPEIPERNKPKNPNLFRQGTKAYHLYSNALQEYDIHPKHLTMQKQIGKGNFSTVYAGVAARLPYTTEVNKSVAIKVMKNSASDSDKQEFKYEFEVMKLTNSLNHKNITKLLASTTRSQPCMIVLELMPNGNLRNYLRATRSQDVYYNLHGNSSCLSERQLLQFGLDIANGMEGIADLQLLHRDLAARNILLDANLTCKISDFGFAKDILNKPEYKSKSVLRRARPVRWLAPESVLRFKHCIQSDVWSYGIVLWEIVTLGNLPYPGMKFREVQSALKQMYRMSCPTHCSPDLYRVMACCWEEEPSHRPPFHQLVDKMRRLLDDATRMIDMERIEDDDNYIDVLPPDEQELFVDYSTDDSLC